MESLRAVQLLLGNSKLESTVTYLGIEVMTFWQTSERTGSERARRAPACRTNRAPSMLAMLTGEMRNLGQERTLASDR